VVQDREETETETFPDFLETKTRPRHKQVIICFKKSHSGIANFRRHTPLLAFTVGVLPLFPDIVKLPEPAMSSNDPSATTGAIKLTGPVLLSGQL